MVLLTDFSPPSEGVRHEQNDTLAFINNRELGRGSLYIAESHLSWRGNDGKGFSLEYPAISLHAVSRDTSAFPHDCLYLMVDCDLPDAEAEDASDEDGDENPITEIRFCPSDKGALSAMFEALSVCQTLHPDPEDTNSEEEEDDEFYYDEAGGEELSAEGRERLEQFDAMLGAGDPLSSNGYHQPSGSADPVVDPVAENMENLDVGQFEDADMDT